MGEPGPAGLEAGTATVVRVAAARPIRPPALCAADRSAYLRPGGLEVEQQRLSGRDGPDRPPPGPGHQG
jgi:hypothetical protein